MEDLKKRFDDFLEALKYQTELHDRGIPSVLHNYPADIWVGPQIAPPAKVAGIITDGIPK